MNFFSSPLLFWSSLTQVKETGEIVLTGAYVDLHGTSEGSPEKLSQVKILLSTKLLYFYDSA